MASYSLNATQSHAPTRAPQPGSGVASQDIELAAHELLRLLVGTSA